MSANPAKQSVSATMQPAGRERRRSERRPFIVETWLHTGENDDAKLEINTLDVSHHGIGFYLEQAVKPGAFYQLEMNFGQQKMTAEIRIISCADRGEGIFLVGAEFC